jgi:cation diffusion facilitator CzcD-associated flavoprotein CzcO
MAITKPTDVPGDIDIQALRKKYRHERDRRLRPDGQAQFIGAEGDFSPTHHQGDPYTPVKPREALSEDIDVAVLGGGFAGILAGAHLRQAGVTNFRNIDHAGDFGGTWYWNRYPGIQCDNDAYCYLPLLEETGYMPKKKFEDGHDIHGYCAQLARHFDLYPGALFHTLIKALRWDAEIRRWRISTDRGDDIRARFVVMANGALNRPKLPAVPGIRSFRGEMFHTARWNYDYTGGSWGNPVLDKLADKRVAILGTGATALQATPFLARYAKQLYVIQRTPSAIDARKNPETDPEWWASLKPGWQQQRQANFHRGAMERFRPEEPDMVEDFWTEINRNLSAEFAAEGWPDLSFEQYSARREIMDYRVMERMRRRVEELVEDKATAEALKPYYRFMCKRPCSNDDFYPMFNRPNVKLIDVAETRGLQRMTEFGFVANGVECEVDCIIFASGYEVTSDLARRWGIEEIVGRDEVSLYDHWADGYRTLHGMTAHNFPNLFFVGFYQGGLNASTTEIFNKQTKHIAYIADEALRRGITLVEPTREAVQEWVRIIRETAFDNSEFLRQCTPSYMNNEGSKKIRYYLGDGYGPGWDAFQTLLADWRGSGEMNGLRLES